MQSEGVNGMEDQQIIALFFDRNQQAVKEADAKYGRLCFSLAKGILGSGEDAEECVNDTWLAAWNSIPPARPPGAKINLGQ